MTYDETKAFVRRMTPAQWTALRAGFTSRMERVGLEVHPEFYVGPPRPGTIDPPDSFMVVTGALRCHEHNVTDAPNVECPLCTEGVQHAYSTWAVLRSIEAMAAGN